MLYLLVVLDRLWSSNISICLFSSVQAGAHDQLDFLGDKTDHFDDVLPRRGRAFRMDLDLRRKSVGGGNNCEKANLAYSALQTYHVICIFERFSWTRV